MTENRVIELDGIHNFRDYGGYAVSGGGRVKSGLLWRSGQHCDASDEDLTAVDRLNLRHVFDFRGNSERANAPCRRSDDFDAEVHFYEGETANLAPHLEAVDGGLDEAGAHAAMERIYRNLPQREPLHWMLGRYLEVLAGDDDASASDASVSSASPPSASPPSASVVHCLAGKDRTGMAVAILHHILGVHPDDAMEDFLLTNVAGNIDARVAAGASAVRGRYGEISDDTIRVLMGVDERYLLAARKAVEESHGSMDAFLLDVLKVDDQVQDRLRLHWIQA